MITRPVQQIERPEAPWGETLCIDEVSGVPAYQATGADAQARQLSPAVMP